MQDFPFLREEMTVDQRIAAADREGWLVIALWGLFLPACVGVFTWLYWPALTPGKIVYVEPRYRVSVIEHGVRDDINENKSFIQKCWAGGGEAELFTERYPSSKHGYSTGIKCFVPIKKAGSP